MSVDLTAGWPREGSPSSVDVAVRLTSRGSHDLDSPPNSRVSGLRSILSPHRRFESRFHHKFRDFVRFEQGRTIRIVRRGLDDWNRAVCYRGRKVACAKAGSAAFARRLLAVGWAWDPEGAGAYIAIFSISSSVMVSLVRS